ncbi:MAG: hypothetical protein IT305_24750 [Chloroflexi bacterium]|nr:hypothetical protein [Chloroflexota bacterium]
MQLTFERGDPKRPRGHAVVYFRVQADPSTILASYVVVPPISMDFSKFIPPMFAAQLPGILPSGPQVFPLPPIPEHVESLAWVQALAESRDDDVLDGGMADPLDLQRMLAAMTEIASEYGRLYDERVPLPASPSTESEPAALPNVDVDDLLIGLMSDSEKVGRLARMTGTVRYAAEGGDQALLSDTIAEMERVGRHLAERYRVQDLIQAARDPSEKSGRLAELLLQRCYRLAAEEYDALKNLDDQIAALRKSEREGE